MLQIYDTQGHGNKVGVISAELYENISQQLLMMQVIAVKWESGIDSIASATEAAENGNASATCEVWKDSSSCKDNAADEDRAAL